MMRCLVCRLCLVLVLISSSSAEIMSMSSFCQSRCGNILIPYPFGIGNGCYLDKWYEVQCRNFVPYLPRINKEVVRIDYPRSLKAEVDSMSFADMPLGLLRVKTDITSMGCSGDDGEDLKEELDFTNSPFYISSSNKLVAFGCNHTAKLVHVEPRIVGCVSACDRTTLGVYTPFWGCDGFRCCNVSTPSEVGQKIGVEIQVRDGGNTTTQGCAVAFLTDEFDQRSRSWGDRNPKWFYTSKYSTIQLEWEVETTNISFKDSLRCRSDESPTGGLHHHRPYFCKSIGNYIRSACMKGYKGNPYLQDGCKDIDECGPLDPGRRPKLCDSGEACVNTPGSYRCVAKKSKTLLIYIGVSIGVSVFLVCACIWLYKYIKGQRKIKQRQAFFKRNGGLLLQQQLTSGEGSVDKTVVFSSKELEKATESFSSERVLGEGGQGTVYKGMLADGRIVAVKKSKALDQDQVQEFINELVILSQINHRNIVSILGCCLETEVPVLVYEFISNGNLFQHLQNQVDDDQTVASWEVRLRIAIDIAGSLSYLHSAASSPVYHKDVKSTNIMLDAKHRAKLSDFGISRVMAVDDTHLTTVVKGTAGYVDPEYYQSEQYTEKSDVYSYGVVLAELITGEKPVSSQRPQNTRTLATYFLVAMRDDRLFDVIDPRIRDGCRLEQVRVMAKIARLCLNLTGERRTTMRDILVELERTRSSSHGDSQSRIVEIDEEEDQAVRVVSRRETFNIDVASTSASQYDYGAAMSTDFEPLIPPQTW